MPDEARRDDPELLALLCRLLAFDADGARADREVGLVLADWLEERDDPRAADVRALAAFSVPEVSFPPEPLAPEEEPEVEEGGERPWPQQPIWRWPPPDEAAPPWWDLLAELD